MRSPLRLALIATLAGLFATPATAGVLVDANWSQVTLGFPMTRTGEHLSLTPRDTESSTDTFLSVGLSYPAFATKFFIPKTANGVLDLAISITQGGPQRITATPSMAVATMGVPGTVNVRTAVHNNKGVSQSTYMTGINTLVRVPLSIGVAGQFTSSFTVLGINHLITVDFYGWTPGTAIFGSLTSKGVALPSVVAKGSFNLGACGGGRECGGGTVTLVSPTKISVDGAFFQRRTVGLTTLNLYFVPEPGKLLLVGAGALALALGSFRGG